MSHIKRPQQNNVEPVSGELVELLLEPLSSLIDQARLEILKKLQDVGDDVEMIARQLQRHAQSTKQDVSS